MVSVSIQSFLPTYLLAVRSSSSRQRRKRLDDFSANVSTAGSLDSSEAVTGRISSSVDSDWFRIQLDSGIDYTFSVDSENSLDTVLRLRDVTGRELLFNDDRDSSTTDSELVFNPSTAGTYYLDVQGFQGSRGVYSLAIDALKALDPADPSKNFNIDLQYSGDPKFKSFFDRAALRWAEIITGDLPDFAGTDDLLVNIIAESIDGEGGTLGQAGFDALRPPELGGLPYLGTVALDSADLEILLNEGSLLDVVTHEIGHVLGIGTLWSSRQLVRDSRYIGSSGTREYLRLGGVEASVPLETSGGQSTDLAHWSESVFGTELMTGFFAPGSNPLSSITIGSLEDLGYSVDYASADRYFLPQSSRSSLTFLDESSSRPSYRRRSQALPPLSLSDSLTNYSMPCRCGTCLSFQQNQASSYTFPDPPPSVPWQSATLSSLTISDLPYERPFYSDQPKSKSNNLLNLEPILVNDLRTIQVEPLVADFSSASY